MSADVLFASVIITSALYAAHTRTQRVSIACTCGGALFHPRLEWQSAALIHPVISFLLFNTDRNLSGAGGGGGNLSSGIPDEAQNLYQFPFLRKFKEFY